MSKKRALPSMSTIVVTFNQAIVSGEHSVPYIIDTLEHAQVVLENSKKRRFRRKLLGVLKSEFVRLEKHNADVWPVIQKAWCALLIRAFEPHKSAEAPPIYEWSLVLHWAQSYSRMNRAV